MTSHVLVIGETQSGKTFFANQLHRKWPRVSIFVNHNHVPDIWGVQCKSTGRLMRALAEDRKVNYHPPSDRDQARGELEDIVDTMFDLGEDWTGGDPWCQIVVDEAQVYDEGSNTVDPVETVATRGLGAYGVRVVAISQYPVGLKTTTRTNLATRVVFRPGMEGSRFIRQQWPGAADTIEAWTDQAYHYCTYRPGVGWRQHTPVDP